MSADAKAWVTVEQFAILTGKSVHTIRFLCREHNGTKVTAKKDVGGRDWLILLENRAYRSAAKCS